MLSILGCSRSIYTLLIGNVIMVHMFIETLSFFSSPFVADTSKHLLSLKHGPCLIIDSGIDETAC